MPSFFFFLWCGGFVSIVLETVLKWPRLVHLFEKNIYIQIFIVTVSVEGAELEEVDVESLLESLNQRKDESVAYPTCVSSVLCF